MERNARCIRPAHRRPGAHRARGRRQMTMSTRDVLPRFALLSTMTLFAALLWLGLPGLGNVQFVWDSTWFQRYADTFRTEHRIPTESQNIEYTLPPGMPAVAVAVKKAADAVGPVDAHLLGGLPR